MKDFIKVFINKQTETKGKEKFLMRKYLGDVTMEDDENKTKYQMSTGISGVGLMLQDEEGNIIGLDSHAFIDYIANHFQEILNEPEGLALLKTAKKDDVIEYIRPDGSHDMYRLSEKTRFDEEEKELIDGINIHTYFNSISYNKAMYLYKRQENGNLIRHTIHEREEV